MPLSLERPENFGLAYHRLAKNLLFCSNLVEVRGQWTKELIGASFVVDPTAPLSARPGFSNRFALTETLQVITGRGDLRQLKALAPAFADMAPSYVTYGPRLAWQLHAVYNRLKEDPTSRQALVQVHMPEDISKGYPDCPCTLSLQFLVRDQALTMIATMRSNDIWYGTPTDVFMFTFLQRQMAHSLGLAIGPYVHQAGSLHVYEQHWEKLKEMTRKEPQLTARLAQYPEYDWKTVREKAGKWLDSEIKGTTWIEGLDLD